MLAEMIETKERLHVLLEIMKESAANIASTRETSTVEVTLPTTAATTTTTQATTVKVTPSITTTTEPPPLPTTTEKVKYMNCKQIIDEGFTKSGFYQISVPGISGPISVFCDMITDGGGWMVFQRRLDGSFDFNRTYAEYARGFGEPYDEYWMGNDLISAITLTSPNELRIEMGDWDDYEVFAKYSRFVVADAAKAYRLTLGEYIGTSGNSLGYHDGSLFSTYDVDNDESYRRNCAKRHGGGWWFKNCMRSNLNGRYIQDGDHDSYADGIEWSRFRGLKYSLMFTEMKMRPVV